MHPEAATHLTLQADISNELAADKVFLPGADCQVRLILSSLTACSPADAPVRFEFQAWHILMTCVILAWVNDVVNGMVALRLPLRMAQDACSVQPQISAVATGQLGSSLLQCLLLSKPESDRA